MQTEVTHPSHPSVSAAPVVHGEWAHVPPLLVELELAAVELELAAAVLEAAVELVLPEHDAPQALMASLTHVAFQFVVQQ